MADTEKKFSELETAGMFDGSEFAAISQTTNGQLMSVKATLQAIANWFAINSQYTSALNTTSKTLTGAINELKQLISLIPQFSIEVVQTLPTEDISDTTIYLVPSSNPETENAYDEFIHVNNTWEQVGSTEIDLSAYYTKLEADAKYPVTFTNVAASSTTTKKVADVTQNGVTTSLYADDAEKVLKKILNEEHTVTGNPISFDAWLGLEYAKSCEVTFSPIQSGTGDPSPENVRPISGRDSVDVVVTGANQWDEEWELGGINTIGELVPNTNRIRSKNYIRLISGESYYVKTALTSTDLRISFYDAEKVFVNNSSWTQSGIITAPTNAVYAKFVVANLSTYGNNISINYPSTVTTYNAYHGQTKTITFSSTIYGGTDEIVGGVGSETYRFFTFDGTENWNFVPTQDRRRFTLNTETSLTNVSNSMCNYLKYESGIVGDWGTYEISDTYILVKDKSNNFADLADFKTYLSSNPLQISCELATPTAFSTTPTPIGLNKGNNVVSTDGDNITLKYSADIKSYIAEQLSSLS